MTQCDAPPEASPSDRRTDIGFWLLIGVIAVVGMGKAVQSDVLDPDCFWHLRVAEQMLREGIGPIVDHLSFSSIKEPWTPYSWLAELGMKAIWDAGGYRLALLVRAAMMACTTIFVALACRELAGSTRRLNCVVATAFFAFLAFPYLSFRPATAAILLLTIAAWLLLRDRRLSERSRAVWLIVPITAIVVNLHLTAVAAPAWIGALLAGAMWEARGDGILHAWSVRRYALMLALTSLACLATPLLPGVMEAAWHYQQKDVMVASGVIIEMQPIWRGVFGIITLGILAVFFAIAYRGRHRIRAGEWLWLVIGTIMVVRLGRFAPFFAIIAAPILATTMPALADRILKQRIVIAAVALSLTTFAWRVAGQFPRADESFSHWLNRPHRRFFYPCEAADWVEANVQPRTGRLINDFNWGGYLAWRLGPKYQTLLDGRTQLFTADFWNATLLGTDESRMEVIQNTHPDAAVIYLEKSAFRIPLQRLGWYTAYRDKYFEVLLPPG